MSAKKDMTGLRFGLLVVLCEDGRTKDGKARWKCKCDCGKFTTVTGKHLRKEETKSCGCLVSQRAREANETHGLTSEGGHRRLYMSVQAHFVSIREQRSGYKGWVLDSRYTDDAKGIAKFCFDLLETQPEGCRRYEADTTLDLDKDNGGKVFCPENVRFCNRRENRCKQPNNIMLEGGIRFADLCRYVGADRRTSDKYRGWVKRHNGEGHPELIKRANELIALFTKCLKLLELRKDVRRFASDAGIPLRSTQQ